MTCTCYCCNKKLPNKEIKRCARCQLVTYCSKDCQAISWTESHRRSCKIHPSLVSETDPGQMLSEEDQPKRKTPEWDEIQVDRSLSRWLQVWRSCFQRWTTIALDLANYPPERVTTHCLLMHVGPRASNESGAAKQFKVLRLPVTLISFISSLYPTLEIHIDPNDFARLRLVVVMQDSAGDPRRVRLIQWNDLDTYKWRTIPKDTSAELSRASLQVIIDSVDSEDPKVVEQKMHLV